MTIDPSKLAGIPKMAAGQAISAAAELDKLCAPMQTGDLLVNAAKAAQSAPPVPTPAPRVVQPDPAFYWADDYGNIWRQAVEPVVVAELGIVLAALLGSR